MLCNNAKLEIMDGNRVLGTMVDGVQRFPPNGIKVIVVGAGVGGLGAALECWRKGCDVVVLERGDKLSVLGEQSAVTMVK